MTHIAIHGAPRSGTTWLGEIINSSHNVCYKFQPLFSYALKHYLGTNSSYEDIRNFFQILKSEEDPFCNRSEERIAGELPTFIKKHITHVAYKEVRYHQIVPNLLRKDNSLKLVAIIRNPIDVMASWIRAPREFRADLGWKVEEEWRYALKKNLNNPENFFGFEKWKESSLLFLNLKQCFPDRVKILSYSNLKKNLFSEVHALFDFLSLQIEQQTISFVKDSQSKSAKTEYGVYRQTSDKAWTPEEKFPHIADEILHDLSGGPLETYSRS